jgi:hypothetical protein
MAGKIGTARLAAGYGEAFEAGSFQSFELSPSSRIRPAEALILAWQTLISI